MIDTTSCQNCGKELSINHIMELRMILQAYEEGVYPYLTPGNLDECEIRCSCGHLRRKRRG